MADPAHEVLRLRAQIDVLREDIHKLERKSGETHATLEHHANILDSITDRFFAFDKDWRFISFNKQAARQLRELGKDPATLIGECMWDVFPGAPIEEIFRGAMRDRTAVTHEHYYAPLNEWVENRIFPAADGGVIVLQCYVTRRKRIEAYLTEGQRLSHTGSWALNLVTGEVFWSDEHFRIFGLDPYKVKPSYPALLQWVHAEDRNSLMEVFDHAVRTKAEYDTECRIVRPDGTIRHVRTLAHPVTNADGELIEYIGTVIDITDRKHAEEELHAAQGELARVMRATALGELTASIAHEVNQPLTAIVTNAHALVRWLDADPADANELRAATERIIRDANRASAVIARICAFVKREDGGKTRIQVKDALREVAGLVRREIQAEGILFKLEFAAPLPLVLADKIGLQQVILNLMLNAIDAMRGAPDASRVLTLGAEKYGVDAVLVTVRDTGVGLDPRQRDQVFDAFFTTKPGGMGMGLAIAHSIVEAHGGRLWVSPNEGRGVTFQFTLPDAASAAS
jgi:PAS domain S-box-containing protein